MSISSLLRKTALLLLLFVGNAQAIPMTQNLQRVTGASSNAPIVNSQGTTCTGTSCAVCKNVTTAVKIIPANPTRPMYCIYIVGTVLVNGSYGTQVDSAAPAITPTTTNGFPLGPTNQWLCETAAPGNRLDIAVQSGGGSSVCTIEYP